MGHALPPPPAEKPSVAVPEGGTISLKPAAFFLDTELFKGSTIHPNTAQTIIFTTEDKIRNYLHEYARAGATRTEWIAPLALAIAIGTTLLTSDFKVALGVPKEYWAALFVLAFCGTVVWLVVSLVRLIIFWKRGSIETLINKIKKIDNA
jgi:hypothetical protein